MNKEQTSDMITTVPGIERSDDERRSIEDLNRALGERVISIDSSDRIVPIADQSNVTVDRRKTPGANEYAAEQQRIADEIRSNKLY